MAQTTGVLGNVAWSGGNPQSAIVAEINWQRFTLDWNVETFDEPLLNDSHPNTVEGIGDWTGSIEGLYNTAPLGSEGLVVSFGGYNANVYEWTLNINPQEHQVTAFNATEPTNHTYILGRYTWGGTLVAYKDDTTTITGLPAGSQTLRLKYDEGTADGEFGGLVYIQNENVTVDPNAPNLIRIPFVGTGALSATGTNSILPTGAYSVGAARELILTETTSRTHTGSALVNNFSMTTNVSQPVRVTVGFRGTGSLTQA